MGFGSYLLALICPPLYFLIQKRYGVFFVHVVLYIAAFFFLFVFFSGVFIWFFLAMHALWDVRKRLMQEHVEAQAQAIVDKQRAAASPPA